MEKKIVGFKLIKNYPLSQQTGFIYKDPSQNIINEYIIWSEYWQPIYEGESVNLDKIMDNTYEIHNNSPIATCIRIAMKEACRQTLELVKKHARIECLPQGTKVDLKMTRESIDNILTMIK